MATWTGPVANVRGPQGPQGIQGVPGQDSTVPGPQGPPGVGVPAGGAAGTRLVKNSANNFDTSFKPHAAAGWATVNAAGITGTNWRMLGLGGSMLFTVQSTTLLLAFFNGVIAINSGTPGGLTAQFRAGTGAPPGAGSAPAGNQVGYGANLLNAQSNLWVPATIIGYINVAPGQVWWFDLVVACESAPNSCTIAGFVYAIEL